MRNYLFKYLVFFLLVGLCTNVISQQKKRIHGTIIFDDNEGNNASGVYVTNLRNNNSSLTDLAGNFSLRVQVGDTIYISTGYYEPRKIVITTSLLKKDKIFIHLSPEIIYLSAVNITKPLTGYLEKDVAHDKRLDVITELYKDLNVNPDKEPKRDNGELAFGKDIGFTHISIGRLYDAFSGNLRRRQNLYDYEDREAKLTKIREYFGDNYFTEDLKIPKEKIRDFLDYSYSMSKIPYFYEVNNFFKILEQLNGQSKIYLTKLNQEKM